MVSETVVATSKSKSRKAKLLKQKETIYLDFEVATTVSETNLYSLKFLKPGVAQIWVLISNFKYMLNE